ncbi:MICOS complex subunit MIC60, mitochondrial isoform X2 [Vitis vinifera]|uniref:MICOS complex subunit MIC60, mitochondrial isoform X2 n=1 Tax=Vitis vinifera TaxID=29760 RepID=UPI000540350F|nr:MICOS complex subunit MIC60, mitochondrial isoform X2 [Vitis vinifera]|eukprot:XP_010652840.1 PREDICTED: uncharacterized protein LOC100242349 isoform X2 [Vitis vinifera]
MLRRSVLEISSRKYYARVPRRITSQIPPFFSSRKEFSAASQQNTSQGSGSTGKPSNSGSFMSKFIVGGVVIGAAVMTAYQTGYLDQIIVKEPHSSSEPTRTGVVDLGVEVPVLKSEETGVVDSLVVPVPKSGDSHETGVSDLRERAGLPDSEDPNESSSNVEHKTEPRSDFPHVEDLREKKVKNQFPVKDIADLTPEESAVPIQEKDLPPYPHISTASNDQITDSGTSSEGNIDMKDQEAIPSMEQNHGVPTISKTILDNTVPEKSNMDTVGITKDGPGKDLEPPGSLVDAYYLTDKGDQTTAASSNGQGIGGDKHFSKEKEASVSTIEDLNGAYISNDGKLVLDFLQAIHAAEKRQAELDAHAFSEQKRIMKEKYEKELKDARVKELMYAEEAAMLEKELNQERAKLAATIKSLQEKAEEKLKTELEQKERESELELKKALELAKAELAAAIASEKASHIEKIAEANLHIDALCMAFYARSEEARQTHSVHKLALGALALEDALSKGLPIQTEIVVLHKYLDGIDKDSLLALVLSSLPEETRNHGTDTVLQLNQKFDDLKATLRHFSLIPPGGGGILAHSLANVASRLKVKQGDQSGDGIESVINRVESYLAQGQLVEAADALEDGVRGSEAAEIIVDWVKQARNRAIAEQALTLLQSYATSVSLT